MEHMKYRIYQMKDCAGKFMGYDYCSKHNLILSENYQEVYNGLLLPHEIIGKTAEEILENLFIKFNRDDRPAGKQMHSLSTSDIIALGTEYYFCDFVGWKPCGFCQL